MARSGLFTVSQALAATSARSALVWSTPKPPSPLASPSRWPLTTRISSAAGLVKLGILALDGTKVQANASKHKAMSYRRMRSEVAWLEAGVQAFLAKAERTDAAEDGRYGVDRRGDEPV